MADACKLFVKPLHVVHVLVITLVVILVLFLELLNIFFVGFHVELSVLGGFIGPEQVLDVAQRLLDAELAEELNQVFHQDMQIRRVV